jgi:hypothetical protein
MRLTLRNLIVPSIPSAVLLIAGSLLIWILAYLYSSYILISTPFIDITLFGNEYELDIRAAHLISILLTLFNALLISQLNNKYSIIRIRSFLPPFIYIFLISCWVNTHTNIFAHLSLTFYLFSLFMTYGMYKNRKSAEQAFLGSLFLGLASFLVKPIAMFLPLMWLGFIFLKSISFRTFLASIIGFITPWIIYFAVRIYFDPNFLWFNFIMQGFNFGFPLLSRPISELIYISSLVIIITIILFGVYTKLYNENIDSRPKLNFMLLLLLFSFVNSLVFDNQYIIFMPFVSLSYSILISHSFTLQTSKFIFWLFIIFMVLSILFVISNFIII